MEGAGAAVGHEHEVARVEAAADDLVLQRVGHLRVGDLDDAEGGVGEREAERVGDLLLDRLLGEVAARLEAAALALGAEGRLGGDVAEDQVGVGDRRLARRRGRSRQGPGSEEALWGPTRRPPPSSSIQAIEPPPAPIEITSTAGTR